jgi:hypothetical protein
MPKRPSNRHRQAPGSRTDTVAATAALRRPLARLSAHALAISLALVAAPAAVPPPASAAEPDDLIAGMKPGTWFQPGANDFASVAYTRADHDARVAASGGAPFWGVVGPASAIVAWQGAAFDPATGRMYFHGGGHSDYGGNEVYQFDFSTLRWSRLTEPSSYTGEPIPNDKGVDARYPAAGPISVHTYDGLAWSSATQSFWLTTRNTGFDIAGLSQPEARYVWEFDPKAREWTAHAKFRGHAFPASLYNSDTREIWSFGDSPAATIVGPDGTVRELAIFGAYNWLSLGVADYDARSQSAIYARTSHGRNLLRVRRTDKGLYAEQLTEIPVAVMEIIGSGVGLAVRDGTVWLWGGDRRLVAWNPTSKAWRTFVPETGPTGDKVYGKFHYWPERDVFVGMSGLDGPWMYRPTAGEGAALDADRPRARIGERQFPSIAAAFAAARDGDTLTILPGSYAEGAVVTANKLTVNAKGAHLAGAAVEGKAALVIRGNDTTIVGLEVSGVAVPDGNGAAIRLEGRGLVLRDVHFHDSQQGLLSGGDGGGTITVEDSLFERLGGDISQRPGFSHGIYVGLKTDALVIRNSRFLAAKEEGHEIKSRAARTVILDSVVDSLDGRDSRLVDVPNAGVLEIVGTTLREGPNSSNIDLIGYGLEPQNGGLHKDQRIIIRNSTISSAPGQVSRFINVGRQASPAVTSTGNEFIDISPGIAAGK